MVLTLMLLLIVPVTQADVLLIEEVRQADNMAVPVNGQTMAEVEAQFGSPGIKNSPVGNPPITQWIYERWSVYFEYDRVLFTVLKKGEVIGQQVQGT
jgi:hypothetical protein